MQLRIMLFFTSVVIAGSQAKPMQGNFDLHVGFRGGINFTQPFVMNRNEVLQGYDPSVVYRKDYSPFITNIGYHYAFMFQSYLNESLSLSFEPAFVNYSYKYSLSTSWTNGTDPADYIEYEAKHRNSISYFELPLLLRYEFTGRRIQPFISVGFTYGYRLTAVKKMEYSVTQYLGNVTIPYENSTQTTNSSESYIRSRFGVAPGIGFFYPLGKVRLMLSADISFSLNNITDESQRYVNSSVTTGMYDVQDDIRPGILNVTLGFLFNTGNMPGGSSGNNKGGKSVECPDIKRNRK
jgi:hypothetical protein